MRIIIIGAGQIGRFIASKLSSENKDVIIIEDDETKISEIGEELDVQIIEGNGASPTVLREAGIKDAQMVVAVTDSDEVNLLACQMSNLQTSSPVNVARVRNPDFFKSQDEETIKKLNIDLLINPEMEAANAILRTLSVPGAVDVINFFGGKMKLVGVKVKEKSTLTDQYLEKLRLSEDIPHILFTTIIRDGETIIPTGRNRILPGDIVYFISETEKIPSIMKLFGYRSDRIKRVMIHGGTFIGMHLAKFLEKHDVQVKIIDSSAEACSKLVRNLNKSVVLNETATDQSFLQQENVGDMGAFIAVTGDDEDNILSTLLAKRLGTPWAVTLTKQISYIPLITTIGVDVVISPRLIANSAILHFIRQGKVLSVSSVQDDIEILEIEALETSNIVNIPIREAKIPKGALILSVERDGNIIIPDGSTVIQPGNKVLVQADNQAISKVEKLFTVKMEYF